MKNIPPDSLNASTLQMRYYALFLDLKNNESR